VQKAREAADDKAGVVLLCDEAKQQQQQQRRIFLCQRCRADDQREAVRDERGRDQRQLDHARSRGKRRKDDERGEQTATLLNDSMTWSGNDSLALILAQFKDFWTRLRLFFL
jgi:hypothetical protein